MVFYSGMTAFYRHYCHFPLFPIFWWPLDNLSFFSRILHPVIKKLIPVSPDGVYPLLAGFLFGFPLGSKIIGQLSENGQLRSSEAQILLSVCNNISPVFITGYMVHQCIGCDAYMLPAILCIYLPPLFFCSYPAAVFKRNGF